jgi:hypothetical protein
LELCLHQGFEHLGQRASADRALTLAERPVAMALEYARQYARPAVLILDAYFAVAPVFQLAASRWSMRDQAPWLTPIVRAKKNYVADIPAVPSQDTKRGRPRQYGDKVALMEVFDHPALFTHVTCQLYGQRAEVAIAAANLP